MARLIVWRRGGDREVGKGRTVEYIGQHLRGYAGGVYSFGLGVGGDFRSRAHRGPYSVGNFTFFVGFRGDPVLVPKDRYRNRVESVAAEDHQVMPDAVPSDLIVILIVDNDGNKYPRGSGAAESGLQWRQFINRRTCGVSHVLAGVVRDSRLPPFFGCDNGTRSIKYTGADHVDPSVASHFSQAAAAHVSNAVINGERLAGYNLVGHLCSLDLDQEGTLLFGFVDQVDCKVEIG